MLRRIFVVVLLAADIKMFQSKCFEEVFKQCPRPKNFPSNIILGQGDFENWSQSLTICKLWTAVPRTSTDVVDLVNWAAQNNYKIRPKGRMHSWSPITVSQDSNCTNTMLVRTDMLTKMQMFPNGLGGYNVPMVRTEPGATVEDLLGFIEKYNFTLAVFPEIGKVTVGGVLAIGGHAFGISAEGETQTPGNTRGTMSNLIDSLELVAWDEATQAYALKTFNRTNEETSAFSIHVGHTFVTSVMLRVKPNVNLRCKSATDIKINQLFAPPNTQPDTNTFGKLHAATGKVTALWFPFNEDALVLTVSEVPTKPNESRLVNKPYNYIGLTTPFPREFLELFTYFEMMVTVFSPPFCRFMYEFVKFFMVLTNSYDIWGPTKNIMLYVDSSTLLQTDMGYTILTKKDNIQAVVSTVMGKLTSLIDDYKNKAMFPLNGPLQIRVTDLDRAMNTDLPPYLSTVRYNSDFPDFNVAIWFDFATAPTTPSQFSFFKEFEQFIINTLNNGALGFARPEWSKSWGYTDEGQFTNTDILNNVVPTRIGATWTSAICTFRKYDPKNVFSNGFLDKLFVTTSSNCTAV